MDEPHQSNGTRCNICGSSSITISSEKRKPIRKTSSVVGQFVFTLLIAVVASIVALFIGQNPISVFAIVLIIGFILEYFFFRSAQEVTIVKCATCGNEQIVNQPTNGNKGWKTN